MTKRIEKLLQIQKENLNSVGSFNYVKEYGTNQVLNSDCIDSLDLSDSREYQAGYEQGRLHCLQQLLNERL